MTRRREDDEQKFKTVGEEIRGKDSVQLTLKETRRVNLVRLKVHYKNCSEKHLLKMFKRRYSLQTGLSPNKFKMEI